MLAYHVAMASAKDVEERGLQEIKIVVRILLQQTMDIILYLNKRSDHFLERIILFRINIVISR